MLIFAKSIFLVLIGLSPNASAASEGVFFLESAVSGGTTGEVPGGQIGQLKFQAVANFLQRYVGPRWPQLEKQVTHDFAERFIMDYKVSRLGPDRSQIQVAGHLDGEGLKKWVRMADARTGKGGSLSPALVISAPSAGITPANTGTKNHDGGITQIIVKELSSSLAKFNIKLSAVDLPRLASQSPSVDDDQIKNFRDAGVPTSYNGLVWLQITPCKPCGGSKFEFYLYNLSQNRLTLARSDDMALNPGEVGNPNLLKNALKASLASLHSDFEDMISAGVLFSAPYSLRIEGITSYRNFRNLESELNSVDFIAQPLLQRAEPKAASFTVFSQVPPEEISSRLAALTFPGFHLAAVRSDKTSVTMKYANN